ncbi:MAG: PIN domain-containing protein [Prosthecobacter sp.]
MLCSLYREQDHTDTAIAHRAKMNEPLRVSGLLDFEFRQAIRLQVWLHEQDKKKGYSQAEADQMLADWASDIAVGVVQIIPVDHDAVLRLAEFLSSTYTAGGGNRTLDIMHVATAKHLSAKEFLTFDGRQKKLAKAVGLKTPL